MSTSTGSGARSTSAANVASLTVSGSAPTADSVVLQRPHTAFWPRATGSAGSRLVAPQLGQRTRCKSVMSGLARL
jgi:hypothetical protein